MRFDAERNGVSVSVTELVAESMKVGDLDSPSARGASSLYRMEAGREAHKKIQASRGAGYRAEVPLSIVYEFGGFSFLLEGRADGIFDGKIPTVEEIKDLEGKAFEKAPFPNQEAQVKCYAFLYAKQEELPTIKTCLTLHRTEDEAVKKVEKEFSTGELEVFLQGLLNRIYYRVQILAERERVRIPSVKTGKFPFSKIRNGQDILLKECYRDIRAGKRLFAEAPTGTGKTVSTLYPAVVALGEGICDKIFYLTAKAAPRKEAFRAAESIFKAGSHLRTIVLTSREQICANAEAKQDPLGVSRHCNGKECPYAKGFFDRSPQAVCDLLNKQSGLSRSVIEEYALKNHICPYEFGLELSEFCDTVICDYNYVFDPIVYLRRYFEDAGDRKYVFLIDEAHNLSDRALAMYSDAFSKEDLLPLSEVLGEEDLELTAAAKKLSASMDGFFDLCRDTVTKDGDGKEQGYDLSHNIPKGFAEKMRTFAGWLEIFCRKVAGTEREAPAVATFNKVRHFLKILDYYDGHFVTFLWVDGENRGIRILCLDASEILDRRMKLAKSSVLFSATLTPPDYFADILGGGKDAVRISLPSPFDPSRFGIVAVPTVSTRMEDREKSFKKIASMIAATLSAKTGNYIAYFPSYDYMEKVQKAFSEKYPSVETVVQSRRLSAAERENFLNAFALDGKPRVGFCTLGGSFSEGVDLPGKRLIGVIVVGTGLPGLSDERNVLRDYYEMTRERGYDYAYVYPGMNRVMQAAGRVIRTEEDVGVLVLIDDRYADERQKMLFPEQWSQVQYAGNPQELAETLSEFWKMQK